MKSYKIVYSILLYDTHSNTAFSVKIQFKVTEYLKWIDDLIVPG